MRYYCGTSAETITGRQLRALLADYTNDGAKITRKDKSYRVELADGEVRWYSPVR